MWLGSGGNMFFRLSEVQVPLYVQGWDKNLLPLVEKNAIQNKIDIRHLCALIQTESSGNVSAARYEVNYPWIRDVVAISKIWKVSSDTAQILMKTSWGLCQVMGAYAIELGLPKYKILPHELCKPEYGILFGCLAWNQKKERFKLVDPLDIYAHYNAGYAPKVDGKYKNQKYVDHFNANLLAFEKTNAPLH